MNKKFVCGAFPSDKSGVTEASATISKLPKKYQIPTQHLFPVIDQGNRGICASVSTTDVIKYIDNFKKVGIKGLHRDIFYNERKDKSKDGMTIRECLDTARIKGFIKSYALVNTPEIAKSSIVTHSPLIVGLPVYNYDKHFWKGANKPIGGHAVILCGYDNDGFILKNSWGSTYGNAGYVHLPYEDWSSVLECWTVLI